MIEENETFASNMSEMRPEKIVNITEPSIQRNIDEISETHDPDNATKSDPDGTATVGNTSIAQTYFNMFKCFIGIGILATPAAI